MIWKMIWFGLVSGAEIVQHASEMLGRGVWSLEFGVRDQSLESYFCLFWKAALLSRIRAWGLNDRLLFGSFTLCHRSINEAYYR